MEFKEPAITFPYELDEFQKLGIQSIENNENILITAHTGAGKSTFAEYAVACAVRDNKKIIYTSPIKTLSNQKFDDFKKKAHHYGLNENDIGIMTGDHKINPDSQCCVMTTEILRNMLYKDVSYFDDIKYVVFDEVHYFNDKERGHVWEECIIMLPLHIILIKLSATIDKAQEFSNWVETIRNRKTNLISTPFRPVPLKHYIHIPHSNELINYSEKDNHFNTQNYLTSIDKFKFMMKKNKHLNHKSIFTPLVEFMKNRHLLPAILFVFSRKKCQDFAHSISTTLVDHLERKEIERIFDFYIHKLINTNDNIKQIENVKQLAMKGIAYHHSGMIPALKEIIEVLFGHKDIQGNPQPLIKVLFATETFAVGVNMPAKTTVFTDLNKFDNTNGMRNLHSHEYTQMAGRAGRRGLDKIGNVIYYPIRDIEPLYCMKQIVINKPEILVSKFKINIKFIMSCIKSNEQEVIKTLENSLMNNENNNKKQFLKSKIIELEENKKIIELNLKLYDDDNIKIVQQYLEFQDKIDLNKKKDFTTIKQSTQNKKKLQKDFNICKRNFDLYKNSQHIYETITKSKKITTLIEEHYKDINDIQSCNTNEICKILNFLKKYDYVIDDEKINIYNINKEHINLKGIVTSEFNEANELLMTEMILNGIFDNIEQKELLSIISIFCDEFDKENEYSISSLVVSDKCKQKLNKIQMIHNNLLKSTDEFNIQYKPDISLQFIDIVWLWCENKTLTEIIKEYDIFEGNFIKNMQKIYNIINELNTVAEMLENHELLKKIQNIENLIIKDIVDLKSLYLI